MISLRDVHIQAGEFRLSGINFTIPHGKYGVLMGSTGCGKTSILEAVAGLRRITRGQIWLHDRDVTHLPPGERQLGYVPQDGALFRTMTVRQQLEFALTLRDVPTAERVSRVQELATIFQITHLLDRRPVGLSGGEVQRVALGRALSFRPQVLLLDEPLSAVDETTRDSLIAMLNQLRESRAVTVLHITHSRDEAERLADVQLKLINGQVCEITG